MKLIFVSSTYLHFLNSEFDVWFFMNNCPKSCFLLDTEYSFLTKLYAYGKKEHIEKPGLEMCVANFGDSRLGNIISVSMVTLEHT